MKENPEYITAFASFLGSVVKAYKYSLKMRQAISSIILATVIGYLMPGLISYFMDDATQQMTIAVSLLIGFSMNTLSTILEEFIVDRFNYYKDRKDKK